MHVPDGAEREGARALCGRPLSAADGTHARAATKRPARPPQGTPGPARHPGPPTNARTRRERHELCRKGQYARRRSSICSTAISSKTLAECTPKLERRIVRRPPAAGSRAATRSSSRAGRLQVHLRKTPDAFGGSGGARVGAGDDRGRRPSSHRVSPRCVAASHGRARTGAPQGTDAPILRAST